MAKIQVLEGPMSGVHFDIDKRSSLSGGPQEMMSGSR